MVYVLSGDGQPDAVCEAAARDASLLRLKWRGPRQGSGMAQAVGLDGGASNRLAQFA